MFGVGGPSGHSRTGREGATREEAHAQGTAEAPLQGTKTSRSGACEADQSVEKTGEGANQGGKEGDGDDGV